MKLLSWLAFGILHRIAWQSLYNIDASSAAGIAFFTNHVPTEFEATAHYLKDDHGDDIEPKATIPEAAAKATEETTDWGPPMLGALTVNLATFIGVFLLFPPVKKMSARPLFGAMLFAFAAGALLACAFFLLLFEATHLVAVGWSAEVDVVWRWGTMILAGLVLPPVVETICSIIMLAVKGGSAASPSGEESSVEAGNSVEAGKAETEDPVAKFRATARLVGAVVIGDFFHNLCDGFFIGAAFKGCGNSFGWSVIVGTILHELPQEVADFVILTGPDVALGIAKAWAAGLARALGWCLCFWLIPVCSVVQCCMFDPSMYYNESLTHFMPKRCRGSKLSKKHMFSDSSRQIQNPGRSLNILEGFGCKFHQWYQRAHRNCHSAFCTS